MYNMATLVMPNFLLPKYSLNHVGIMIGTWQFDFTNLGLVIPSQDAAYGRCVLCLDLADITSKAQYEQVMQDMADACVLFNTTKTYGNMYTSEANCHTFTDYVLQHVLGQAFTMQFKVAPIRMLIPLITWCRIILQPIKR